MVVIRDGGRHFNTDAVQDSAHERIEDEHDDVRNGSFPATSEAMS